MRRRLLIILFPAFFVLEGSVAIDGSIEMADEVASGGTHILEVGRKVFLSTGEKVSVFKLHDLEYPIGYFARAFRPRSRFSMWKSYNMCYERRRLTPMRLDGGRYLSTITQA